MISYWSRPLLLFAHFKEIESVSLKKRAKRVKVIKDKIFVLDIQETLLLYIISENHHFKPILSSFLIPLPFSSPPFNSKHKNAFDWEPYHFLHMLDKRIFFDDF